MKSYVINIDKLKLIYNNKDIELLNKSSFDFIRQPDTKHSLTHQQNYLITYNQQPIFYLLNKERLRTDYSKLIFINEFLYNNSFNDILNLFIDTFKIIDFYITDLEISINTNKKLTRNYYNYFNKKEIKLLPNYKSFSYLPSELRFTNIVKNDTIYIKKLKSPINIRIENKTKEIKEHSKKQYILDYYNNKGLSITKDIYRLEMRLDLVKLRNVSRYTKYQSKQDYSNIISLREFKKLDYLKQSTFNKISLKKDYIIDTQQLCNESYLLSLFDYFKTFNYSKIIKTNIPINKLIFENSIRLSKQTTQRFNNQNDYSKHIESISLDFDSLFR